MCKNNKTKLREYKISVSEQICKICNILKNADSFDKNKRRKNGLCYNCKDCRKIKTKNHYFNNSESIKKRTNTYYHNNKEKLKPSRIKYTKMKFKEDPFYRLSRRLRNRLYYALKKKTWKKDTHFSEYIGCDRETLIKHIESQFQSGMSWDNVGKWEIDHIIPLASATTEEDLYKLSHYTNLQPMWPLPNRSKGSKIL